MNIIGIRPRWKRTSRKAVPKWVKKRVKRLEGGSKYKMMLKTTKMKGKRYWYKVSWGDAYVQGDTPRKYYHKKLREKHYYK